MDSKHISVTLPNNMLEAVEKLARHIFNSRSGVIRQAVAEFLSKPENSVITSPREEVTALKYEILKADHAYLMPDDPLMINFLYDQRNAEQNKL